MRYLVRVSTLSLLLLSLSTNLLGQAQRQATGNSTAYLVNGVGTVTTLSNSNFATIATLTLPAGTYLLSAKVSASNNPSINSNNQLANCVLWNGTGTASDNQVPLDAASFYNAGSTDWQITLPLMGSVTFKGGGAVTLQCQAIAESGTLPPSVQIYYWQLLAVPVAHLEYQTN